MTAKVLMVQGTASHAGKSLLVAALCRIFRNDGYKVAPFKAQNMSLNSFVTPDGGEIGRAQAVQAEAAGIPPAVEMNPILLKPEANSRSQVVVMGHPRLTTTAADYYKLKAELWPVVTAALDRLRAQYEIVVIEGAGSPAEINLARDEIVNMAVARYCQAPVLLVADIDRGGVFASLLGTLLLLEPDDRPLVKAMIINKFRGDQALLEPGLKMLEARTGVPVAGVLPYFKDIQIAQEDSLGLEEMRPQSGINALDIAVIRLPHIANFDDFDPPAREEGVRLRYVDSVNSLGNPDLIIIPGSKTTIADLDWLEASGLADSIIRQHRQGAFVIGICGGYQMLGESIDDPDHVESTASHREGLGLLPVSTVFLPSKETNQVKGAVAAGRGLLSEAAGLAFEGYEIHMGKAQSPEEVFNITERSGKPTAGSLDGKLSVDGRVLGTYVHGLFNNRELRRAILGHIARAAAKPMAFTVSQDGREREYDKLAEAVRQHLDMGLVYRLTGLSRS